MEGGAGVDVAPMEEQQAEQHPAVIESSHAMETEGAASAEAPLEAPADPELEAFNSLWSQARETNDFQTWTSLLSTAERLNDMDKLRHVYDAFLAEYPLCFGYWKKYAEAEARHGQPDMAAHVYERGVAAVPYSVDIWAHFAAHRLNTGASQEEVEGLFERAIPYVGSDYNAHALWDKYIKYEHNISNTPTVAALYTRVLGLPLRDLDRYYNEFQAYAKEHTAAEMASPEEANEIRAELEGALRAALEVAAAKKRQQVEAAAAAAGAAEAEQQALTPEGQQQAPAQEGAAADAATAAAAVAPAANGVVGGLEEGAAAAEGPVAMDTEAGQQGPLAAAPPAEAEGMAVDGAPSQPVASESTPAPALAADAAASAEVKPAGEDTVMGEGEGEQPEVPQEAQQPTANGTEKPAADAEQPAGSDAAVGEKGTAAGEGPVGPEAGAGAGQGAPAVGDAGAALPIPIPDIADADIKRQWMARREATYKAAKGELEKRQPFEKALRRPYYHVKPVDPSQLAVWSKYLDWSEAHADDHATVRLYERCMVPCANYAEFWVRYVRYLDAKGDADRAKVALHRAASLHCKRSPQLLLFAARRRELQQASAASQGSDASAGVAAEGEGVQGEDQEGVRETYARVASEVAPGLVQCAVQRANYERRQGDPAAACRVLEEALAAAAAALQQQQQQQQQSSCGDTQAGTGAAAAAAPNGSLGSPLASYAFLAIQYAHFLHAVLGDAQRAQRVYAEALACAPHSRALWEGAVHLETVVRGEGYVERVLQLYERATAPPPPAPAAAVAATGPPKQEPAQQPGEGALGAAPPAKAPAAEEQQQQSQGGAAAAGAGAGAADGATLKGAAAPGAAGAAPAPTAGRGLPERDREELCERMVAFADLHGTPEDLRRAEQLHHQRFRLPLALLGGGAAGAKKRGGGTEDGGSGSVQAADAKKAAAAAAAAAGLTEEEAATAAAAAAAASAAAAAMDYYGSYGYDSYGYGAAGYGGYYAGYGYGY